MPGDEASPDEGGRPEEDADRRASGAREEGSDDRPAATEDGDATTEEDEFTDAGGQVVAEPPAGRPEVASGDGDAATEDAASSEADLDGSAAGADEEDQGGDTGGTQPGVPDDVRKYDRFKKVDGAQYDRVNEFLRERTYITAREWAIARLCADFRTETGVEMTKIGENLPHLVPFMTDTYTPQAVNQARSSFEEKVRKAGATFLYGAMSDFFTADELDDLMYEVTEVAKFLLEVEGVDLAVEEELEGEERISSVMREVRRASDELRYEGTTCPNCGHEIGSGAHEAAQE